MVLTCIFILLSVFFVVGFVLNPRHREENGSHLLVLGCVFFQILIGIIASFYTIIGVKINLKSICVALACAILLMIIRILWKRKMAKLQWCRGDIISLAICFGVIIVFSIWRFGTTLKLTYSDVDAARYMQNATQILYAEKVSGPFLTKLMQALMIALCQPFLHPISYYKALILSHIMIQILNVCMFYVLVAEVNKRKYSCWINTLITILFWAGFPLCNSLYGTFIQSMNGAIIVMLLLYYMLRLQKEEIGRLRGGGALLIGLFGLLIGYPFFLTIIVMLLMPEAIIWIKKNLKSINSMAKIVMIFGIIVILGIGLGFAGQRFGNSLSTLLTTLRIDGSTYKSPYMDFLFFIPVLVRYIIILWKEKKENYSILRINLMAIGFIIVWFFLYLNEYLSSYYYYRMYYIMWLVAWVMVADTFRLVMTKGFYAEVIVYVVFYGFAILSSSWNLNENLEKRKPDIYFEEATDTVLCPIYKFNYDMLTKPNHEVSSILSESDFYLYNYVIEELGDEQVMSIHSQYSAMQTEWYLGITNLKNELQNGSFDLNRYSLYGIAGVMDERDIRYVLVSKSDPICMRYYDSLFSKVVVVAENSSGYILDIEDKTWRELINVMEEVTPEMRSLYAYVYSSYEQSAVQLVGEGEIWNQAVNYSMYAGTNSIKYVGNISPQDFLPCTYMFNLDEAEYMAVLKDSEMYRQNQEYFDSQIILFENEAGMVITHTGNGWMPNE